MFTPTENLLLNMTAGLLPEHLAPNEIELLTKKYGKNWFETLGYSEPEYKRPKED
jgi:hypothetical protein